MPLLCGIQLHLQTPESWNAFSRSAVLYQNRFFNAFVTYKELLKNLKHFTLYDRKRYFDALFFLSFLFSLFFSFSLSLFSWSKMLPVSSERYRYSSTVCNFRIPYLSFAASKNSPTARCLLAANIVFKGILVSY